MLERLKSALTKSYVGAIAVGWLVAQGLIDVSSIIVAPSRVDHESSELSGYDLLDSAESNLPYWLHFRLDRALVILLIAFCCFAGFILSRAQHPIPKKARRRARIHRLPKHTANHPRASVHVASGGIPLSQQRFCLPGRYL